MTFLSQNMISAEIWYNTHNGDVLAIIEVFKSWKYNLKDCKYEILIFTNHNNLQDFMDTKDLSSK